MGFLGGKSNCADVFWRRDMRTTREGEGRGYGKWSYSVATPRLSSPHGGAARQAAPINGLNATIDRAREGALQLTCKHIKHLSGQVAASCSWAGYEVVATSEHFGGVLRSFSARFEKRVLWCPNCADSESLNWPNALGIGEYISSTLGVESSYGNLPGGIVTRYLGQRTYGFGVRDSTDKSEEYGDTVLDSQSQTRVPRN
ncbi:hypothetical protein B0H14DRAFT_2617428 [Mycena olivaceomarginata]|nr:hypothetical protein B0H14DRAFT_2617428 [Mycena olivaceomarginata]